MGEVRERWVKTTDRQTDADVGNPAPDFDSTKTYPVLLYCQGGPQSVVSQRWSFRWNFQLMAAQGYIVVGAEPARAAVVRAGVARPDLG